MQLTDKENDLVITEKVVGRKAEGFLRTFAALRHRNFRLFWFGQLISLTGTWMQTTGQSWLVLELTRSALALGIVGALQFLPVLFLALFGGVLADRLPKRRVLLYTQTSAMVLAAIQWILVATGTVQVWHVFVLSALLGLTNALDMPTRQAFVVEMVGHDDAANAVALNSTLFNMARVVGPGVGGLLIAWLGIAPLFLLNAISFIPVIIGLAIIDISQLHTRAKPAVQQGTFQSLGEGLRYITQTPAIFLIIAVVGVVSLFGINFNVVLPVFATDVLHSGPEGFGFISAAFGIGAFFAALWLAWRKHQPSLTQMLGAAIIFGALEMVFAISHLFTLSVLLIAGVGFSQIAFTAVANASLQTMSPDRLRGRIMSVYMLFFAGSTPLGNLFIGALAHAYGAPVSLLICGGLSLIAAVIAWLLRTHAQKGIANHSYIHG